MVIAVMILMTIIIWNPYDCNVVLMVTMLIIIKTLVEIKTNRIDRTIAITVDIAIL